MRTLLKVLATVFVLFFFSWLLFGFFGIQALFTDRTVSEEVPYLSESSSPEESPEEIPLLLQTGSFVNGDSAYTISGNALITEKEGGYTLSFTDFSVSNGPDLFVYLVSSSSADNASVKSHVSQGEFINLGALKGNIGNQNYLLPEGTSLENVVVSIWCRRFSRNFGMAVLAPPSQVE